MTTKLSLARCETRVQKYCYGNCIRQVITIMISFERDSADNLETEIDGYHCLIQRRTIPCLDILANQTLFGNAMALTARYKNHINAGYKMQLINAYTVRDD